MGRAGWYRAPQQVTRSPLRLPVLRTLGLALLAAALFPSCKSVDSQRLGGDVLREGPGVLSESNAPAWRAYILPDAADMAYASIPWHVTFADGLTAARAEGKPLLMWAMNGHPLGCT